MEYIICVTNVLLRSGSLSLKFRIDKMNDSFIYTNRRYTYKNCL